ncbi:MAG: hypothetical protein HGA85_07965 [Nanoarchaeota archaeon]|nr:hypothetical protein [Nanoarchaeota archaeon]
MKRKVMKIADTTFVVSLPLKWAKAHNLKKGDEIEIAEEGSNLRIISDTSVPSIKKGTFDAHNFNPIIKRAFDAMYKAGYDEIKVSFASAEELNEIESSVNNEAMSFEIIKQDKDSCVVKSITEATGEDFDAMLRRTFMMIHVMGEDLLKAIKENDMKTISYITNLEKTNNKFTHYLRRYLNKKGYHDPSKTNLIYTLVEQLETIADEFKYLCQFLTDKRNQSIRLSDTTLLLFESLNKNIDLFSNLFFDFKVNKAVEFHARHKELVDSGIEFFQTKPAKEVVIIHYLVNIEKMCFDLLGPILACNL